MTTLISIQHFGLYLVSELSKTVIISNSHSAMQSRQEM